MADEVKKRLVGIKSFRETRDAGFTCPIGGISRPTLRKWLRRFEVCGEQGLVKKSRKPHHTPTQKVFKEQECLILETRKKRRLGARGIQHEIARLHNCRLLLVTIDKFFQHNQGSP